MPQRETRYARLGEQITRLVRSLAAVKGWNMTQTMNYIAHSVHYGPDMIHRWRQGKACPLPEAVEALAQIGNKEANLWLLGRPIDLAELDYSGGRKAWRL